MTTRAREESKIARWVQLCSVALKALEELDDMRGEWEDIYDNMNEELKQTPYGLKLKAVSDLDFSSAIGTVTYAEYCEMPRWYATKEGNQE
jgi:hypothetical protein